MRPFSFHRPETPALAVAAKGAAARFLAGGTNLVDLMKADVERPAALLDLSRLGRDLGLAVALLAGGHAAAQSAPDACPQLPASSGLTWEYKAAGATQFCRALRADGVTTLEIKSGYGLDLDGERKMLQVARDVGETLGLTVRTTYLAAHAAMLDDLAQALMSPTAIVPPATLPPLSDG